MSLDNLQAITKVLCDPEFPNLRKTYHLSAESLYVYSKAVLARLYRAMGTEQLNVQEFLKSNVSICVGTSTTHASIYKTMFSPKELVKAIFLSMKLKDREYYRADIYRKAKRLTAPMWYYSVSTFDKDATSATMATLAAPRYIAFDFDVAPKHCNSKRDVVAYLKETKPNLSVIEQLYMLLTLTIPCVTQAQQYSEWGAYLNCTFSIYSEYCRIKTSSLSDKDKRSHIYNRMLPELSQTFTALGLATPTDALLTGRGIHLRYNVEGWDFSRTREVRARYMKALTSLGVDRKVSDDTRVLRSQKSPHHLSFDDSALIAESVNAAWDPDKTTMPHMLVKAHTQGIVIHAKAKKKTASVSKAATTSRPKRASKAKPAPSFCAEPVTPAVVRAIPEQPVVSAATMAYYQRIISAIEAEFTSKSVPSGCRDEVFFQLAVAYSYVDPVRVRDHIESAYARFTFDKADLPLALVHGYMGAVYRKLENFSRYKLSRDRVQSLVSKLPHARASTETLAANAKKSHKVRKDGTLLALRGAVAAHRALPVALTQLAKTAKVSYKTAQRYKPAIAHLQVKALCDIQLGKLAPIEHPASMTGAPEELGYFVTTWGAQTILPFDGQPPPACSSG